MQCCEQCSCCHGLVMFWICLLYNVTRHWTWYFASIDTKPPSLSFIRPADCKRTVSYESQRQTSTLQGGLSMVVTKETCKYSKHLLTSGTSVNIIRSTFIVGIRFLFVCASQFSFVELKSARFMEFFFPA